MADKARLSSTVLSLVFVIFLVPGLCVDLSIDTSPEEPEEPEERECYGTWVGFSYSGTLSLHYDHLRKRYAGCTHITGNLEITNLIDPKIDYDLSFLKDIRYVSGYVLLGLMTEVQLIPLLSLEMIRGNSTYPIQGDEYSLVVVLTSPTETDKVGLTDLQMPKLKEISTGKILFTENPSLGYIDTIDWLPIMRGRWDAIHILDKAYNQTISNQTDTSICPNGGMWGNSVDMCQAEIPDPLCDDTCRGRCFASGPSDCCHDTCAIGCTGRTNKDCLLCKDYTYDDTCVGFCPAMSYPKMQQCVKYSE